MRAAAIDRRFLLARPRRALGRPKYQSCPNPELVLSYPRSKVWRVLDASRCRRFIQNFTKFLHQDTQFFRIRFVDDLFCYVLPLSQWLLGVRDGLVSVADCVLHLNTPTLQILLFAIDLEKLTAFAPKGMRSENPFFAFTR